MSDPNDPLEDLFNDFDETATETPPAKKKERAGRGKQKRNYRSAFDEQPTNRRQIAQATGKKASIAGKYVRRSFTYRPDQLEGIETLAGELGLSQNDLMRWFVDMGIDAVEQGQEPPLTQEVRRRYKPDHF